MDIEAAVESIWQHTLRRSYFPKEWQGRLTIEQAYRVQLGILDRWVARGERLAGWKVGLTAPVIQKQFGMPEPVMGFLLESGHRESGAAFRHAELIAPGFENELCLTVGTRLEGAAVTRAQARAAITAVQPAFEIIEGRGDFRADLPLALCDNSQQRAFVTGPASPLPPGWEPADTTVEVLVNGRSIDRAVGSEDTGHPVGALVWLAKKLSEFGRRIEPGHRIMSGSFTKQYPIARGDRLETRFTLLGAVRAAFD
ncbi:MAG TPA: fumarylacetoacetate hydrolase family protein [Methylomirabilota bacterium]|jgi:2-keto-4-pentenoate hydratase|nr:fumarylacetoacetate hydrolase family protein [Methylomirabilota bacterium]